MGKKQEEKLQKLNSIYTHSVKGKKGVKSTPTRQNRIALRKKDNKHEDVEETVGYAVDSTFAESEIALQRTLTLPALPGSRPASQRNDGETRNAKERRVSFPMINTKSNSIFNTLHLDSDDKNDVDKENIGLIDGVENTNSKTTNVTENSNNDIETKESLEKPQKTSADGALGANQGNQNDSRALADQKILEGLLQKLDNENAEGTELESSKIGTNKVSKLGLFRRVAQKTRQAKKISDSLIADLNLRYLHAVYNDTDYNEKYERLNTPDIETDEEKDDQLLQEIHEEAGTSETQSDSDIGMEVSSSFTEWNESDHNESDSDTGSPEKIPDDIKDIIENAKAEEGDDLRQLGIWNEEADEENPEGIAYSNEEADDADNEESGDDWSIATLEDAATADDDDNSENETKRKKAEVKETQKPLKTIPLPNIHPLPLGDTPDINASSSEESVRTVYASRIDAYESDVFGPRFQHDMFYKPPSLKSDAGDSDMFYCVPSVAVSFYSTRDYFQGKGKGKKAEKKVKRLRQRRELNEQFVRSAMKKHAVQDMSIARYGIANKTFRLRMARLGKDPKETDEKANARIEKQLRKRVRRKPKKPDQLTKNNVKRLPNLSKKAHIMRWVTLYDKNGLIKTFFENGWVDQQGRLTQSAIGQIIAKSQDPLSDSKTQAEIIENGSISNAVDQNEEGKEGETLKQHEEVPVDEKAEYQKTNSSNPKRIKKRRKRKILDNLKRRKRSKSEKSSEDSFFISKDWQITVQRSKSIDGNEEDEEMPKSEHSDSNEEQESNSEGEGTIYASSSNDETNLEKRSCTPESESEPEPEPEIVEKERHIKYEKRTKKQNTTSHWGVVPDMIISKKKNTLNNQLAEITRLLFAQLSLKTNGYSKLPPIKRSGAFSMATNRSARMGHRKSSTEASRNSHALVLETP